MALYIKNTMIMKLYNDKKKKKNCTTLFIFNVGPPSIVPELSVLRYLAREYHLRGMVYKISN